MWLFSIIFDPDKHDQTGYGFSKRSILFFKGKKKVLARSADHSLIDIRPAIDFGLQFSTCSFYLHFILTCFDPGKEPFYCRHT